MENPESDTCIRCGPAPEACNPLQLNGIDMESAALETPADTRHSPQTSQQTYLLMSQPLSYYDNSSRNLDARLRFSSAKQKSLEFLRKYEELTGRRIESQSDSETLDTVTVYKVATSHATGPHQSCDFVTCRQIP